MDDLFNVESLVWLTHWCFAVPENALKDFAKAIGDYGTIRKNYLNKRKIRVFKIPQTKAGKDTVLICFFVLKNGLASYPDVLALQEEATPLISDLTFEEGPKILRDRLLPKLPDGDYVGPHCFKKKNKKRIQHYNPAQPKKPRRKWGNGPSPAKKQTNRRKLETSDESRDRVSEQQGSHNEHVNDMVANVQGLAPAMPSGSTENLLEAQEIAIPYTQTLDPNDSMHFNDDSDNSSEIGWHYLAPGNCPPDWTL